MVGMVAVVRVLSAGCSAGDVEKRAIESAATSFVNEYQDWAIEGYPAKIPVRLEKRVRGEARQRLHDDAIMYEGQSLLQLGRADLVSLEVFQDSADHATVNVMLDQSGVKMKDSLSGRVLASGQGITEVRLLLVRDGDWLIVDQEVVDDGLK